MTKREFNKAFKNKEFSYQEVMEMEFGRKAKPGKKLVRSLMSGAVIEIAKDTPLCCDPSSETYWSM